MIKRLLLCLAFAICPSLWGESVASSNELEAFEELASTEPKRALELSMYYQGWGKDECFYVFDDENSQSPITRTYVKDSELTRQIKMRDFAKALHFAEIAFKLIPVKEKYKTSPVDEKLKAVKGKVDLNLMKLYILRGEEFAKETYDFFVEKVASHNFEKDGKLYGGDLYRKFDCPFGEYLAYSELHVYFYYKGFGVEKDIQFAKDIWHNRILRHNDWRVFYIAKYYPKDLDFVKFLMGEDPKNLTNNHFLHLIYSGKFNPEEKNEVLAQKYFDLYEEKLNEYIERDTTKQLNGIEEYKAPNYSKTLYARSKASIHLIKYFFYGFLFDKAILVPNPYYNIDLAKKYMNYTPYNEAKTIIMYLFIGYAVKDSQKYLEQALKREDLSQAEKADLKKCFNSMYNQHKRLICNDLYNDTVEIDFDSL